MKPTYYWLTREDWGIYCLTYLNGQTIRSFFCDSLWHKFTGIRLPKGTKVKVKVTKLKNGFKMQIAK